MNLTFCLYHTDIERCNIAFSFNECLNRYAKPNGDIYHYWILDFFV